MMRKIGFWLVGMALLLGASSLFAASSGPANVLVVYNAAVPKSQVLAEYYQNARGIPDQNMLGVTGPTAWTSETVTDAALTDYTQSLYDPVILAIAQIQASGGRIDYVVLCRNLPYNVSSGLITDTVDGALMSPGGAPGNSFPPYYNDFYNFSGSFADYKASGSLNPNSQAFLNFPDEPVPFLVTRLDGASWSTAQKLVDLALKPRNLPGKSKVFLNDGINSLSIDPANLTATAATLTAAGIPVDLVSDKFRKPSYAALGYFSYGGSDKTFNELVFDSIQFAPGSIGEVADAGTTLSLRQFGNWASQINHLLEHGITGVVAHTGEVTANSGSSWYDPAGFADPNIYLPDYFIQGQNLADSFFASLTYIGFSQMVIGDPLCTYLGPGFQGAVSLNGVVSTSNVGGFSGWGTTGNKNTSPGTVKSNGSIGGTGSWINGGGAGKSDTSHGW